MMFLRFFFGFLDAAGGTGGIRTDDLKWEQNETEHYTITANGYSQLIPCQREWPYLYQNLYFSVKARQVITSR